MSSSASRCSPGARIAKLLRQQENEDLPGSAPDIAPPSTDGSTDDTSLAWGRSPGARIAKLIEQEVDENTSALAPGLAPILTDSSTGDMSSASVLLSNEHDAHQTEQKADEHRSTSTSTSSLAYLSVDSITEDMSSMEFSDPSRFTFPRHSPVMTPEPTSSPTEPTASLPTTTILQTANSLPQIPRFNYLLKHTLDIIQSHEPYDMNDSGHLTCSFMDRPAHSDPEKQEKRITEALAAAQDSISAPQPDGPVLQDLKIFTLLWTTTISVIEIVLESNLLSHQNFGWGVLGIAYGYQKPDELFKNQRKRLHAALESLSGPERPITDRRENPLAVIEQERTLTQARRSLHKCAVMLLQTFRRDWERVRWLYAIRACERWLSHLRWGGENGRGAEVELREGVVVVAEWSEKEGLWLWKDGKAKEISERPQLHLRTVSWG